MPKFLRIGVHQSNVSGYTSKAWCVRCVGSAVFLKWGAVEVQGTGEHGTFDRTQLDGLLDIAVRGIQALDAAQVAALGAPLP